MSKKRTRGGESGVAEAADKAAPHTLAGLTPSSFEHLANALALRVLGPGLSYFCTGPDAGRDGYFHGTANYPSLASPWSGTWFIQSKFHPPGLTADGQKWLRKAVAEELEAFSSRKSHRQWPDNWIVVSNVDPSGTANTGTFDATHKAVSEVRPQLADRFHIWGEKKILDLLSTHRDVAERYGHFLTPGHVLAALRDSLVAERASTELILRSAVGEKLLEQKATRLEEAGAETDVRPPVHRVFVDLPFRTTHSHRATLVCASLASTLGENHISNDQHSSSDEAWRRWRSEPKRAAVWFIKGGPGNGKSTIGQFIAQTHRAALVLSGLNIGPTAEVRSLAADIKTSATNLGVWPESPRIPFVIELKKYSQWSAAKTASGEASGLLSFIASQLSSATEEKVSVAMLRTLLFGQRNLLIFDGLDEVPSDQKDIVASAVVKLVNELRSKSDTFALCTSRPQGYAGQFRNMADTAEVSLVPLPADRALSCAKTLLSAELHQVEAAAALEKLTLAFAQSHSVRELMTTPLQVHIMCVIVRNGHRPPERRWTLFNTFYNVIRLREANRELPERQLAAVLHSETKLLKDVHARLGFVLHARSETATGAEAQLSHPDFTNLVRGAVEHAKDQDFEDTISTVVRAARDRLVLISTPESADSFRFDVRQLQEFFAAEYVYMGVDQATFIDRLTLVAGDQHWREVVHFILSALAEQDRRSELSLAVQIVGNLDRGEGPEESLLRGMARGAAIVSQLAMDGVLDEDKTIRNMFRDLLVPLVSCTDDAVLQPLANACCGRPWLLQFITAKAEERVHAQAGGAAIVLWNSVRDEDAVCSRVESWFCNMPTEQLASILTLGNDGPEATHQRWHSTTIRHHLTVKDTWNELGALSDVLWGSSLLHDPEVFGSGTSVSMLRFLTRMTGGQVLFNLDGYTVTAFERPTLIDAERLSLGEAAQAWPDAGAFGHWRRACACILSPGLESYATFLTALGGTWEAMACLPPPIRWYIGEVDTRVSPQELARTLDDETLNKVLSLAAERRLVARTPSATDGGQEVRYSLDQAADLYPDEFLDAWVRRMEAESPQAIGVRDQRVARILRRSPHRADRLPATLLIAIFALDPALRLAVRAHMRPGRTGFLSRLPIGLKHAQPAAMPDDDFLLPPICGDMLSRIFLASGHLSAGVSDVPVLDRERDRREYIEKIVSPAQLRTAIACHDSPDAVVATAAVLLLLSNRDEWETVMGNRQVILRHASEDESFGPLVALSVELAGQLWNPSARVLVGELLAGAGMPLPDSWNSVLARWRERSAAPVSSCRQAPFAVLGTLSSKHVHA